VSEGGDIERRCFDIVCEEENWEGNNEWMSKLENERLFVREKKNRYKT
jgi:hypothetical protein